MPHPNEQLKYPEPSLALLSTLVAGAPIGFGCVDDELRFIYVNEALATIHGEPVEAHIGRSLHDMAPRLAPALAPFLRRVLETNEPTIERDVSGETAAADGLRSWVISCYPVRGDGTRVVGVGLMMTETTERRRTDDLLRARARQQAAVAALGQRALAGTELTTLLDEVVTFVAQGLDAEYVAIFEAIPDGKFLLRAGVGWKGGLVGYTTVGDGTQSQAGYTVKVDEPVILQNLVGETRFAPTLLLQSHGIVGGLSVPISGINRPFGVLGAHTRLMRRFSDDDVHFLQAVANIVAAAIERSRAQEELLKTGKLESVGLMAGGIAHDFNNLLTAILGNISLAKISLDPESKMVARLTEATKACLQAKTLTHQLLTFSRGGPPVTQRVEIGPLLRDWTGFALRGASISSEHAIPEDLWPVEADEGQIGQVIGNLVLNAKDAMPAGGTLRVAAENVVIGSDPLLPVVPGRYVKISVSDQGTGIPAAHLSKIFDPFFTTKPAGTGLGLTTANWIATRHRGHVTVDSTLNHGSTFFLYLPASTRARTVEVEEPDAPRPGKGKILFMDDEAFIRDFVHALLTHYGYSVESVPDGADAVARYRAAQEANSPFDAVILDLTVPGGMGGRDAITALLELDPGIRAIVSSGYTNDPVLTDFETYGFAGAVAKPYRAEQLEKALHRVLRRRDGATSQDAA